MQAVSITTAAHQDIPALTKLVNSAYRGDTARKGWTHEADLLGGQRIDKDGIRDLIEDDKTTVLKCEIDGAMAGCVCLEKKGNLLYLGMLTVAPEMQNHGIGKKLLVAAEAHARQVGCAYIEMTVISIRKELIEWYERHGYINTGETRDFPSGDPRFGIPNTFLEFVVLEKKIEGNGPAKRSTEITRQYLEFIDRHIEDVVTGRVAKFMQLNQIASELAISHQHLTDTVQKEMGNHPCHYYDAKIILKAEQLLNNPDLSIADIAHALTYDPSNFSKFFKKWKGMTPVAYRKSKKDAAE